MAEKQRFLKIDYIEHNMLIAALLQVLETAGPELTERAQSLGEKVPSIPTRSTPVCQLHAASSAAHHTTGKGSSHTHHGAWPRLIVSMDIPSYSCKKPRAAGMIPDSSGQCSFISARVHACICFSSAGA